MSCQVRNSNLQTYHLNIYSPCMRTNNASSQVSIKLQSFITKVMLENKSHLIEEEKTIEKRSYSYQDLLNLQSPNLYSSIGNMIQSQKPTSHRATFGKAERSTSKKVLEPFKMAELQNYGKQGKGPGAYLPPRFNLQNGQTISIKDPTDLLKYKSVPSHKIPQSERKGSETARYNYMNLKEDILDVNEADLKRKHSTSSIKIGTQKRFHSERPDKAYPGPTYDPVLRPEVPHAPKYTLGSRRSIKGYDPLVPTTSTTKLVGPGSYFQKGRSQSTGQLNRIPLDARYRKEPVVSFTKGPKFLTKFKNSVDETYDIKTKTIMAHYDFEYDAGKGLNTGKAYNKKAILANSQNPLIKNKMGSYTITHASREKQQKRGVFASSMTNAPTSVRIAIPKF